ncbi:MAG: MotA/TolQ/ExbB proton channel family protein [Candidatus Muirbacterium halophilum]|nr:MotA/TolQ/ExbB proton channel family protein [Candidatus Muirbacterium halophilum]MCK9475903.1 MotA/TolQ/ExbB proton channel family protein [Candidatus Muirbacterium halophilum]
MYWKILIIITLNIVTVFGNLTDDIKKAESILEKERKELVEIRNNIDKERIPLAKDIMKLNSILSQKRDTFRYQRNILMSSEGNFEDLKKQLNMLDSDKDYVFSLIQEYLENIPKTRVFSDIIDKNEIVNDISKNILDSNLNLSKKSIESLITHIGNYNKEKIGGRQFIGNAINKNGDVINGIFYNYGPVEFFTENNNSPIWTSLSQQNRIFPVIVKNSEIYSESFKKNQKILLPVDISLGEAQRISELERGLADEFRKGGYILYPIIALGIICFITIIYKIVSLWNINLEKENTIEKILEHISECNISEAFKEAKSLGKALGPVIYEGIHHMNASKEDIEEIMHEKILFQLPYLQKNLTILAVSAAASPLLGLLGTVTGMIHTFNLVTVFGSGKASLLSNGISEALITTKYGLIVAIPALLAHAYFSRKVKKIISRIEQLSIAFINGLKIKDNCKR